MKNKVRYLFANKKSTLTQPFYFEKLRIGSSASPLSLTYDLKSVSMYFTCASVNGSTSFEPVLINTVMTGAGQVGGRVRINMSTDVVLGGWANALKVQVECNTSGRATGLLSALCVEMVMPASDISGLGGHYAALEVELRTVASSVSSVNTAFIFFGCGGDSTAIGELHDKGNLFNLFGFGTATDDVTDIFHLVKSGTTLPTHALRIKIDGVDYDLLMAASSYTSN